MAKTETEKSQFLEMVLQKITNKEAQTNIYSTVFGGSYTDTTETSFFLKEDKFCSVTLAYPELEQVKAWDCGKCTCLF